MPNTNYYSKYKQNKLIKLIYFLIIIFLLRSSNCQEEDQNQEFGEDSLSHDQLFNNIIKFDNKNYQTSNFAKNKMVI